MSKGELMIDALFTRLRGFSAKGHRSKAYLDYVRSRPCCICGSPPPSDPHHFFGSMGPRKTSDYHSVAMCRPCHTHVEGNPLVHRFELMVELVKTMTECPWI